MKPYWIEPGQQDFQPFEIPCIVPVRGFRTLKDITWNFQFNKNCWYNWLPDKDQHDWNKLVGLTDFFTANNKTSIMVVFRPFVEKEGFMELTLYANDSSGKFEYIKTMMVVPVETPIKAVLTPLPDRMWELSIECEGKIKKGRLKLDKAPSLMRGIKLWMGGDNNSEGQYGGKSSQRMDILLDQKINYKSKNNEASN